MHFTIPGFEFTIGKVFFLVDFFRQMVNSGNVVFRHEF
jgi:hypothetical protein